MLLGCSLLSFPPNSSLRPTKRRERGKKKMHLTAAQWNCTLKKKKITYAMRKLPLSLPSWNRCTAVRKSKKRKSGKVIATETEKKIRKKWRKKRIELVRKQNLKRYSCFILSNGASTVVEVYIYICISESLVDVLFYSLSFSLRCCWLRSIGTFNNTSKSSYGGGRVIDSFTHHWFKKGEKRKEKVRVKWKTGSSWGHSRWYQKKQFQKYRQYRWNWFAWSDEAVWMYNI